MQVIEPTLTESQLLLLILVGCLGATMMAFPRWYATLALKQLRLISRVGLLPGIQPQKTVSLGYIRVFGAVWLAVFLYVGYLRLL